MTSRFDRDRHQHAQADAVEERRLRREAIKDEEASKVERVEAPPEKAELDGPTYDDDPHDWRRDRQERIDRDEERY